MLIQSKNWEFVLDDDGYHLYLNECGVNSYHDLPAIIYAAGSISWYLDNQMHRENDLPAFIDEVHGILTWVKHGKIHRDNGPAHILDNGEGREEEFWIDGKMVTSFVK